MTTRSEVINLIKQKIADSEVFVENLKGNDHLQVTVIATEFNGLSLVKQHQLVYSALKEELASEAIHALALKTATPSYIMENLTKDKIRNLIDSNPIMVFMKGTKLMPQCGFSNNVVQILNSLGVEFNTFDVLSDFDVREGIKEYSDWPTIPQVYLKGEFLGGSDILIEMFKSGSLKEKIEIELAS